MTLYGEFRCKLDAKGRLRLPGQLTSQLGGGDDLSLVLNRGFERCLFLYPVSVWEKIAAELNALNVYDKTEREFLRFMNRGVVMIAPDSANRVVIPKMHRDYAELKKEVVITPLNDRFEIWPVEHYGDTYESTPEDFSALAQKVLGNKVDGA